MPDLPEAPLALAALAAASGAASWFVARANLLPDAVSARSNHARPTSRAGGTVVLMAFLLATLAWALLGPALVLPGTALLLPVFCAGLLGLADDRLGLPAGPKLLAMTAVAALTALAAGPVESLPVPGAGWLPLPSVIGYALAACWVLVFLNVFNFMDGLNGMAAGTGTVLLAAAALLGGPGWLLAAMGAALVGFAVPNVLAGRPFLGDAGSLSVGCLIAGGALAGSENGAAFWLFLAPATPFLADAGLTLLARARAGEPVLEAHSRHAYQRLHRSGWRHGAVSAAYALLALWGLGAAWAARGLGPSAPFAAILLTALAWWLTQRGLFALRRP